MSAAKVINKLCVDAEEDSEDAGDECRRKVLASNKMQGSAESNYSKVTSSEKFTTASGVPVSQLDDKYTKATLALKSTIEQYATLDVYDKKRQGLVKQLKVDSSSWVSKYAPGGSARKLSARKMYIAVDSVMGYIASAGLAPLPAGKYKVVKSTMAEAVDFLADGR